MVALASLVIHIVVRLMTAFSVNYYMFIVGRMLTSVADIAWYSALYVFSEYNGTSEKRVVKFCSCRENKSCSIKTFTRLNSGRLGHNTYITVMTVMSISCQLFSGKL